MPDALATLSSSRSARSPAQEVRHDERVSRASPELGPDAIWEGVDRLIDRAPTLVVVSCALTGDPIQDEEDLHASACAAYIVLLAGHNRGLASYWSRTLRSEQPPGARRDEQDSENDPG